MGEKTHEIIDTTGAHVGTTYHGVELTGEDDTPEMRALIDQVTQPAPVVIDVTPSNPPPELPATVTKP